MFCLLKDGKEVNAVMLVGRLKEKRYIKCSYCLPLALRYALSLNHHCLVV